VSVVLFCVLLACLFVFFFSRHLSLVAVRDVLGLASMSTSFLIATFLSILILIDTDDIYTTEASDEPFFPKRSKGVLFFQEQLF